MALQRQKTGSRVILVAVLMVICYFTYHAMVGRNGLSARADLQVRVADLERQLKLLRRQQNRLQRKTDLLNGAHIDPDMLDELARGRLSFTRPGDIIVYTGPRR